MRRLLCSISGFVALLSLTHAQAGTFVVSAAAATNTTTQWMPGAGPQFDLGSQVGFAPAPAPFPYLFSSFFKASSAVPAPPATRTVTGPRQTSPTNVNCWRAALNVYN